MRDVRYQDVPGASEGCLSIDMDGGVRGEVRERVGIKRGIKG